MSFIHQSTWAWQFDTSPVVRRAHREGQMAAACGHPITDCPYPGVIRPASGRNIRRSPRGAERARQKRAAWLSGWEFETAAIAKENADAEV